MAQNLFSHFFSGFFWFTKKLFGQKKFENFFVGEQNILDKKNICGGSLNVTYTEGRVENGNQRVFKNLLEIFAAIWYIY